MPQKDEHVDWAIHDRNFWASIDLDSSPYLDWAPTGMFYESLNWVEAFLATKGSRNNKFTFLMEQLSSSNSVVIYNVSGQYVSFAGQRFLIPFGIACL